MTDHKTKQIESRRWKAMIAFIALAQLIAVSCRSLQPASTRPQDWNRTRGPVIPHDKFPTDCTLCHESGSWTKIRADFQFDHAAQTGVPLLGAHLTAQCLRCHNDRGPVGQFARQGCIGCHQDTHRGQLGSNCQDCHGLDDWTPKEQIARHNRTSFPLVGVHAGVACFRCHPGAQVGNFARAPNECAFCHQQDLARATLPNHQELGWTQNCQQCHAPTAWQNAQFSHTRFPLVGAHATADCAQCHKNHQFQGLSHDCFACHTTEYQNTTMPNHAGAGFSTDCKSCHSPMSWQGSGFIHTKFPLSGAHAAVACATCHQNNVYTGLSHDCFACHAADYQATTQPNHASSGFSTNCQQCHGTASWSGSSFAHTKFALTGKHATVACASCHKNNVYSGLAHDCFSCHATDYQNATNPNHAASNFPNTCQTCHDTNSWNNATFSHTFNITSGPHSRLTCAECHRVANNFAIASCTHCHEHQQAAMDNKHRERSGYSWSSPACIQCHPTGRHD